MTIKRPWHIRDFVSASCTFNYVQMSELVPNNCHLRDVRISIFFIGKTVAEGHHDLQNVYGDAAPSEATYHGWFRRFKHGYLDVDDRL